MNHFEELENVSGPVELSEDDLLNIDGAKWSIGPVTGQLGCFSVNNTVCNGTCSFFGTNGCC